MRTKNSSDFATFRMELRMKSNSIEAAGSFIVAPEEQEGSIPLTFEHLKGYIDGNFRR
ncbi:MAG: hypothetical protein ABSF24_07910 [Candidatus Bathyarchaeia archaeon]